MSVFSEIGASIIDANQKAWTWGTNSNGVLGRGEGGTADFYQPALMSEDKWKVISLEKDSGLGIKEDGSLWGWGNKNATGIPAVSKIPIQVSGPASLVKFKKVACGQTTSYALDEQGRIWACGAPGHNNTSLNGKFTTHIAEFTIIYDDEKRVLDFYISGVEYTGAAYNSNVSGIFEDGTLFGFGSISLNYSANRWVHSRYSNGFESSSTMQGIPIEGYKFKKIGRGVQHALAIDENNSLWGTGGQQYGQLGVGNVLAYNGYTKLNIENVKEVACGVYHSVIIKTDGTLWAAGRNNYGQLGDNTTVERRSFIQIGEDLWEKVSCGNHFTIGLKQDGTVWAWGLNTSYQLGVGDKINKHTPTRVLNLSDNIVSLSDIPLIQKYIVGSKGVFELKSDLIVDLSGFNVRGTFPAGTHTLIQVSDNGTDWKTFESDNWISVSGLSSGLTVQGFSLLAPEHLKWLDNKEIYLKVIMWTDDENVSPLFESIDARVLMSIESPEVEASSLSYSLSSQEEPNFFLSEDNGTTWNEIEVNEVVQLQEKGKEGILIKAVLKNGQEIDALAYSWK